MADRFYDTDERRATIAVNPTSHKLHREITDADLSMYTAKSGTPLLYRARGVGDMANDVIYTPASALRPNVMWESSSNDVTCFADDETVFCNRFNIHNCLVYLNQVCTAL